MSREKEDRACTMKRVYTLMNKINMNIRYILISIYLFLSLSLSTTNNHQMDKLSRWNVAGDNALLFPRILLTVCYSWSKPSHRVLRLTSVFAAFHHQKVTALCFAQCLSCRRNVTLDAFINHSKRRCQCALSRQSSAFFQNAYATSRERDVYPGTSFETGIAYPSWVVVQRRSCKRAKWSRCSETEELLISLAPCVSHRFNYDTGWVCTVHA